MSELSDTVPSFVVYAASAIYVIGMPEIMHEFQLREQEALLGLSVYVLACKYCINIHRSQIHFLGDAC
jgi:hypothetical protein